MMATGGILYSDHIVLHWYKNLITVVHICFWIVAIKFIHCHISLYKLLVCFVLFCLWAVCCQRQPSVCSELQCIQSQHNNFIYVSFRNVFRPILPSLSCLKEWQGKCPQLYRTEISKLHIHVLYRKYTTQIALGIKSITLHIFGFLKKLEQWMHEKIRLKMLKYKGGVGSSWRRQLV
jgi:hypothetical protein